MTDNFLEIKRLPVCTESGIKIGYIFDIAIDTGTHDVNTYFIRPNFFSATIYTVNPSQIKEIKTDRIVVFDAVLTEQIKQGAPIVENDSQI